MLEKSLNRGFRTYQWPEKYTPLIWSMLGVSPSASTFKNLAQDVLRMSDFYIAHPQEATPWQEPWCQRAQACYFLPLNCIRNQAVVDQGIALGFFSGIETAIDVGSGLGAVALAAHDLEVRWSGLEISSIAQKLSQKINPSLVFTSQVQAVDLVSFSYSMTEDLGLESVLPKTKNLWITEPALREDARHLQSLRDRLTSQGWSLWAPCTHQEHCPLLENPTDWCHDRVHFQAPDWFLEIESHLPMKNSNLAHSYLLASKRPAPDHSHMARVVSDYLVEKGKSKLVLCHSGEKETVTWLHRNINPEPVSRGALVRIPTDKEIKGSESRLTKDLQFSL